MHLGPRDLNWKGEAALNLSPTCLMMTDKTERTADLEDKSLDMRPRESQPESMWHTPAVPVTREAETGELLEPRRWRLW